MATRSMFFDAVSGDRSYDAASLAALLRALTQRDGVVYGYGGGLAVAATAPASMNVTVATGAAFVQGRMCEVHTSGETLAIGAADPVNPRIDRVVVKLDNSSAVRSVSLAVKAGTPAASPTPPALQRDGTVWELSLAQVYVAAGTTSISAGNITDERNSATVCGWTPMLTQPAARVYHNTGQSIPHDVNTALSFNSEYFDTDAIHDTAINNSRLTCKTAGKYLISANIRFAANATGHRYMMILLNGSAYIAYVTQAAPSIGPAVLSASTVFDLVVGDYVEVIAYQTSGAALAVEFINYYTPVFMMVRVG